MFANVDAGCDMIDPWLGNKCMCWPKGFVFGLRSAARWWTMTAGL
jgi:hypothetical protein